MCVCVCVDRLTMGKPWPSPGLALSARETHSRTPALATETMPFLLRKTV